METDDAGPVNSTGGYLLHGGHTDTNLDLGTKPKNYLAQSPPWSIDLLSVSTMSSSVAQQCANHVGSIPRCVPGLSPTCGQLLHAEIKT